MPVDICENEIEKFMELQLCVLCTKFVTSDLLLDYRLAV